MSRTLLFLGASVSQVAAIKHARAAGFRVVAVDGDPNAIAFPYTDIGEAIDFTNVEQVTALGARLQVDGVLAVSSDRAVLPAAAVAAALGLPGIGVDVAERFTNKAVMRSRLAEAGVAQPRSRVLASTEDVETALAALKPPVVLKPADSGGQRGLFLVESAAEIRMRLPETLALSRSGQAILEEYLDGVELNCLVAVRGGEPTLLTLSDRLRPAGIGFGVGWIHSFPSSLPKKTLDEAREVAFAAVRTLGLRDGIAFPQLIATATGVRVVEVAARIAAGQMADLVWLGTGVSVFDIAIAQALGDEIPDWLMTPRVTRPIAIRFLTASPGVLPVGTVSSIDGLDAVCSAPGVLAADLYFGVGATIRPVQVDADRSGYVIATAATPEKALELADAAAARLVVHVRDAVEPALARPRRRRVSRVLSVALAGAILLGAALALFLGEGAKLQQSLIAGTRVDKQFSPSCRCPQDVARIAFRLLRRRRVTFQIVNAAGRPVTTLVHDRVLSGGVKRFDWRGRNARGRVLPNGDYRPEVIFDQLHRTVVLPQVDLAGDRSGPSRAIVVRVG
jgi:biotin carboxylase